MLLPSLVALLLAPQAVQQVEPILEREIGSADGALEEVFGRVSDLAADADGNVYVLDQQSDRVRVFSVTGAYVTTFGQRGFGAGQLNRPIDIGIQGETVTVLNPSSQANEYSRSGELLGSVSFPFGTEVAVRASNGSYAILSEGTISRDGPRPTRSLIVSSGENADTVLTVPSTDFLYLNPMATSAIGTSLCGLVHVAVDPEGTLWVASGIEGSLNEVRLVDGSPEILRTVGVALSGISLPDDVRAEVLTQLPRQIDPESDDLYVPVILSPICGLEYSDDDTVWVRLADADGREHWVGVDTETLDIAHDISVPEGVTLHAFASGRAYGIRIDDARVTRVVVYRIE